MYNSIIINLPICVIPSHLLDDITSHSFYPIVKWLFSSFLPFVAFRIPRNFLPFLPFFPYNYIPINLLCGCFLSFFPPPFFPSFQSMVAVGSTHVTKDPSPITASIFNNVNGGLHTHTCITCAHLHMYYLYNRHGMYTYVSTYLPPPSSLSTLYRHVVQTSIFIHFINGRVLPTQLPSSYKSDHFHYVRSN